MVGDTVPADLFVVLAEALEAADGELEALSDPECGAWPLPDEVQRALDRGLVCEAVLDRLRAATTDEGRAKLDRMIEEEAGRTSHLDGGPVPILPEIKRELDSARETLRRAALADRDVDDALRRVLPKGWAW